MEPHERYELDAMTPWELDAEVAELAALVRPGRQRCCDLLTTMVVGIGLTLLGLSLLVCGRPDMGFPLLLMALLMQMGMHGVLMWEDWRRAKAWEEDA